MFREEEQDKALLPDWKEEEEEAPASNNIPKIRSRRRLPIPPALLFKPTSLPSPDLRKSFPSTTSTTGLRMMPPPTVPPTLPSRSLIRRFADAVAGLVRSVTATVAGTPDNVLVNDVGCNIGASDNAAKDEDAYDPAKCEVGSIRTYCRNCRRYHYVLISL